MPPRKKSNPSPTTAAPVSSYKHDSKRARIPTQEESVKLSRREKQPVKKKYDYDPSLDPQLTWAGKKEQGAEFDVPTVPIYVQEKIAPEAIIARLKAGATDDRQMLLFGETAEDQFHKAVEFYKHEDNWQNRLILGDSLLVMNSLLEKEGMRGKVQTAYIDPPYGINFKSNWQVSTRNSDVKNTIGDFIRQPEQVKAFRDTWELGIHSYLSYLRDRLITVRELLTESGSCFVQINSENSHLIAQLMDEVFGNENFVANIIFRKKTLPLGSTTLETMHDHIFFYAKDKARLKFRHLFVLNDVSQVAQHGPYALYPDGTWGKISVDEFQSPQHPKGTSYFRLFSLIAPSFSSNSVFDFEFEGKIYPPPSKGSWVVDKDKLTKLSKMGRLQVEGKSLSYRLFYDDFPYKKITNVWDDVGRPSDKIYAVQTADSVIARCLLMATDPGDIVLDPTCGSGTTAYVAEQWGRRWITTDTSRVALSLARARLMTAKYPFYKLKDEKYVSAGFEYESVPHVTLKSLANDEEADNEVLYDKPLENKKIVRVAGPFTVESLSPHRVSDAQDMVSTERFVNIIIENLLKAGVQTGEKGARVEFENLDILPSGPEVQAVGEYKTKDGLKKVAVAIGPEFGSVDDDFIRDAVTVAKRFADLLVVAATSFDASAHSVTEKDLTGFTNDSPNPNPRVDKNDTLSDSRGNLSGLKVMKVKINPDLSMGDLLKKTGSGNLFLAFGEPELQLIEAKEGYVVEILGVDVYDPVKSEIRTSGSGNPEHDIAAWFIDTNYNGEAFFVTHAYFLGADKPYEKLKKALKADINEDLWEELYSTTSRPFPKPKTGKIAVKVINHYGDEVMKIVEIR